MPDVQALVNEFVNLLKKRKIEGSQATAKQTAELLRSVISHQRLPHTNQATSLINAVRAVGEKIIDANPIELSVGNIVRRVLHIIREEDLSLVTDAMAGFGSDDEDDVERDDHPALSAAAVAAAARSTLRPPSLQTLLEDVTDSAAVPPTPSSTGDSDGKSRSVEKGTRGRKLKHDVIEAVNELIQDITSCHEQIAEQAVEHIHQNEVILTLGSSKTVFDFLCAAKEKKRSFKVFVAEGGPRYRGHLLAKELAARGLQTTVIADSASFAMISRVNMVIVGAHAVMANGGVIAPIGLHMVALAARRHAVPFVVLAGSHKLCPLYPHNPHLLLNELRSPSELLDFGEFSDLMDSATGVGSLHVVNPAFDYVPPDLVSLFITGTGGHNPSYMYRLIADYYSAADLVLKQRPTTGN
ncbi:translation initiation factor eIF-2B subunit beta [Vigna radiata var. radiata]|uniref:Translation initiation factor eIF2B subunit beta n=1 Tax=Vigna radiata var. radiata TaxID=3916 RepID=A0A1S3U2F0_VIGRR|nr:translation initiation factor eIF-2B subunit beta [Vigna radiata var. radiata]XP_014500196.1 translation initiation factor eIF-2B subunit beta [Vigna radiata var. radiata]